MSYFLSHLKSHPLHKKETRNANQEKKKASKIMTRIIDYHMWCGGEGERDGYDI